MTDSEQIIQGVYASKSDVEPLIKFIDDDASDDLFQRVLQNADDWVNANLLSNSLSIWTQPYNEEDTESKPIPSLLNTAATYYAASDVVEALYTGEDLQTQYEIRFQKAEKMINAYIIQQKDELARTELKDKIIVKHSHSRTYNEKRGRL